MNSRNRALSAIWLEEADKVPVSEYDINMPIATAVLGREALVGYDGRFMDLCYRMLCQGKRDKLVARMEVDSLSLREAWIGCDYGQAGLGEKLKFPSRWCLMNGSLKDHLVTSLSKSST